MMVVAGTVLVFESLVDIVLAVELMAVMDILWVVASMVAVDNKWGVASMEAVDIVWVDLLAMGIVDKPLVEAAFVVDNFELSG